MAEHSFSNPAFLKARLHEAEEDIAALEADGFKVASWAREEVRSLRKQLGALAGPAFQGPKPGRETGRRRR